MTPTVGLSVSGGEFWFKCIQVSETQEFFSHLFINQANEGKAAGGAPETMKTEPDSKAKGKKLTARRRIDWGVRQLF